MRLGAFKALIIICALDFSKGKKTQQPMDCAVEKGEVFIFRHLGFVQMTFRVIAWCNWSSCYVRTQKNIQKNPCHCQE